MPAIRAPSAAPTSAIPIWTDGRDLYIELRDRDGYPRAIRYPLTTVGLQSALGVIRTKAQFDGAYVNREAATVEAAKQFLRSLGDKRV